MTIEEVKAKAVPILKRHDVEFAGVFGSVARGEAGNDSDIDILVRFGQPLGLFKLVGLEQELSELIGQKVELVSEKYLHPLIKNNVAKDLKVIYGQRHYI